MTVVSWRYFLDLAAFKRSFSESITIAAVYGISWELCEIARRSSLTAESSGFPASWPSDLQCANVSYSGPSKSYNHIMSLPVGAHRLWTGILMEVR